MANNVLDKLTVTFVVTEECNFRCKYCYMTGKNKRNRMSFAVAKDTIDFLVREREQFPQREIVWEFIGGEPLLEIDLIEQIVDYIQLHTYECGHPWFEIGMFSMSSNGSLYMDPKFQQLLDRYKGRFDVGMTIDGPVGVHDMERRFPDGSGTHAIVIKNVETWLKRFPGHATKVTISHDTVPFIAESILYLFSLGIKVVHSNVVFEDVWQSGDDELLEEQLNILGDTIIERSLWKNHECSFFSRTVGNPLSILHDNNWCGAGKHMLAVDASGIFYPCVRFMAFSLAKQPAWSIGNIQQGIIPEKLEPFLNLTRSCQSTKECMECEIASGCAWCQGFNYDESGILNCRATFICKMHKARVRANKRFWTKIDALLNLPQAS